jgi:hypothetical protein
MEGQAKEAAPARGPRQVSKLLRVLVMGAAVLASNCATTASKSGPSGDAASHDGASRDGGRAPEQGGGVQGW